MAEDKIDCCILRISILIYYFYNAKQAVFLSDG